MSLRSVWIATALVCSLGTPTLFAQCEMSDTAVTGDKGSDIVTTAMGSKDFSTLVAAVKAAGLVEALQGDGPFTVFAPTNAAFAKLPEGTLANLLKPENKDLLSSILTFHVVPGRVLAESVVGLTGATTLQGQRLDIEIIEGGVTVDGASVVTTDILCRNGVIHVIDTVILPANKNLVETATAAGSFGTLLAAAQAAGLVPTLTGAGPFTVFAPTDAAFAKLPKGTVESLLEPKNRDQLASILKFHVVAGRIYSPAAVEAKKAATLLGQSIQIKEINGSVLVNDAKVLTADLDASNGVIHVIDSVLLPK